LMLWVAGVARGNESRAGRLDDAVRLASVRTIGDDAVRR
jgi:hypothetical protein